MMMLYQILIFLRYRVFLTLVHYNIFAYVLGLVENEGMMPEAQVNCCKSSHSVEPRNSERLPENAHHRSTESRVFTTPGTLRMEMANWIHHPFNSIKVHHMFINRFFVMTLIKGDLVL